MTGHELYELLKKCGWETDPESVFHTIWGQPFDGMTEKIVKRDAKRDTERDTERDTAVKESFTTQPQPIATAPEYTRILVYCQRPAVNTGWWQIAEFDEEIGEWLDDAVDGESCLVKPTYWLPLPPPPATEESSATLIEPLADGITYTRSYQVFLPNPPKP